MMTTKKALAIMGSVFALGIIIFFVVGGVNGKGLGATLIQLQLDLGKVVLLGGRHVISGNPQQEFYMNDVWYSSGTLQNWTRLLSDNPSPSSNQFEQRDGLKAVYLNGKIYMLGGTRAVGANLTTHNDVWSSSDNGATWTRLLANAPWAARSGPGLVAFNNKLWLVGGSIWGNGSTIPSDVWNSSDGINWTRVNSATPWGNRSDTETVVFQNKLWVIGGADGVNMSRDVWSSVDGVTWTPVIANAPWAFRFGHATLVFQNKIWLIGGAVNGGGSDVWSSVDGANWTQITANASWGGSVWSEAFVYANKMWLVGGGSNTQPASSSVWSSSDGLNWTLVTNTPGWFGRHQHTVVVVPASQKTALPVPLVPINPTIPIGTKDYCPNISGIQSSVPTGYVVDPSGNCVKQVIITPTTLQNSTLLTATSTLSNETCNTTTAPWIKVISPNGGEVYRAGQQVEVKWKSCNYTEPNISIALAVPNINNFKMGIGLFPNTGIATITLPTQTTWLQKVSQNPPFPMPLGLKYKFVVESQVWGTYFEDYSDNLFTINQ